MTLCEHVKLGRARLAVLALIKLALVCDLKRHWQVLKVFTLSLVFGWLNHRFLRLAHFTVRVELEGPWDKG